MLNRTLCDVLGEMRKCTETANYSYLAGLIEEAQSMGNRMESALWDQKEIKRYREEYKELKTKIRNLKKEKKDASNI